MWVTIAIVAVAIMIGWSEVPQLRKQQKTRELVVFYMFLTTGTVLCIAEFALQLSIPSPLHMITFLFKPVNRVMETLLQ